MCAIAFTYCSCTKEHLTAQKTTYTISIKAITNDVSDAADPAWQQVLGGSATITFDALDLVWSEHPDGLSLHVAGNFDPVAHVEPDGEAWRVRFPDGRRSDVMAIGAAKDFAASAVLASANQRER